MSTGFIWPFVSMSIFEILCIYFVQQSELLLLLLLFGFGYTLIRFCWLGDQRVGMVLALHCVMLPVEKKSISHTPKRYIETQSTCVPLWAFICSFFSSCVLLFFHFLSLSHSLSILCSFDWNSFLFLLCFCVEISSHSTPIVLAFTVILACIANRLYSFIQLYTFD